MDVQVVPPLTDLNTPPEAVPTTTCVQSLSRASIAAMRLFKLALPMLRQWASLMRPSSSDWAGAGRITPSRHAVVATQRRTHAGCFVLVFIPVSLLASQRSTGHSLPVGGLHCW